MDCRGGFTLGPELTQIRNAIYEASDHEIKKVILNLPDVDYIDSSGLGVLVSGHTHLSNLGIKLVLLNVTERVRKTLAITKLEKIFDVFADERHALAEC